MKHTPNPVVVEHLRAKLVARGVPHHLHAGLVAYITERQAPGSFLLSVLRNDLAQAVFRMAPFDGLALMSIVQFLYAHAPSTCHGTEVIVDEWLHDPEVPEVGCD